MGLALRHVMNCKLSFLRKEMDEALDRSKNLRKDLTPLSSVAYGDRGCEKMIESLSDS